ncbi:MAG: hypothetical protein IJC30_03615 [Alphaproteobacteria bacterium]|nr:hypothetical protein [Alphaproteobacteria bacterium]
MKVYTQGEVDFFCGVYAVLNACRKVICKDYHFSYYGGCAFFRHLIQTVIDAGRMEELLHHGTSLELMKKLLDTAIAYVFEKTGISLTYEFPYEKTTESIENTAKKLKEKIEKEAGACIFWVHDLEMDEHWTTVTDIKAGRFKLMDSYNTPFIPVQSCLWLPERAVCRQRQRGHLFYPRVPKGKTHLMKQGIIFISKSKELDKKD